jgi:outer membrane receptor protein involved in Fe transport
VVVAQKGNETLPAAYGVEAGITMKPLRNLLLNGSLWYSYLQQEYVYGGDGGSVEFSGRTRRLGLDLSARYQPWKAIYLDVDLNYAHGRAPDEVKGEQYIPLAPVFTSAGGIGFLFSDHLNGSLRYRWMGARPANESNTLRAEGYYVNDLVLNYTTKKYEIGLTINNLTGHKWKETQFATETRLKGREPVDGICFTPGTKFAALLHCTLFF